MDFGRAVKSLKCPGRGQIRCIQDTYKTPHAKPVRLAVLHASSSIIEWRCASHIIYHWTVVEALHSDERFAAVSCGAAVQH